MTPRNLLILVIIGIVALGGGWYFGTATKPVQQVTIEGGRLAFPDLTPKLKDAQRIEVVNQGKTTTIALANGRWGLADRAGYPVIDSKLRGMLTALTELRLVEPRTSDPEQLRRLGVEEPDAKDSKSTLLRLLDGSGKPILAVITGHRRVRTQGKVAEQIYVRFPGDNQAWLAEGALQVDADPQLWLNRDVMNIENKRIAGVIVTRGDEVLGFTRKDDKLVLTQPADAPVLDEYRVDDVARALEHVNFQDVQPDSAPVGEQIGQGVFVTADGLRVTATVFKAEKDILARFAVAGDDSAKAEIEQLSTRLSGWTYQLGAWKEKALAPSLADLKKAEEKPADPAPQAAPNADAPPAVGPSATETQTPVSGTPATPGTPGAPGMPATPATPAAEAPAASGTPATTMPASSMPAPDPAGSAATGSSAAQPAPATPGAPAGGTEGQATGTATPAASGTGTPTPAADPSASAPADAASPNQAPRQ